MVLQGKSIDENCQICLHPITNPVCNSCYLKQVENWLISQGMRAFERGIVLSKIKENLPGEGLNPHLCIACLNEHLSLCSYCFFFNVARILRELNFSEKFLENFDEVFNYERDEEREEYI